MVLSKIKVWDILTALFILGVVVCGTFRAKYDSRWSAWALGDAQNLNAAIHFVNEGFKEHHFLPYYHPGFLGKSFGNESKTGYYTRYPPLSALWLGLQVKWFGNNRAALKTVSVLLSSFALLFCYLAFSHLLDKSAAFIATIMVGSSIGFLQFIDCLSPYLYSEFFRFSILFLFLLSENRVNQRWRRFTFGLTWVFLILESLNSLDYILFFQIFFVLYYILVKKNEKFPIKRVLFFLSAPLIGYVLHVLNVSLALKTYGESVSPTLVRGILEKVAPFHKGPRETLKFVLYFFKTMNLHMVRDNFGFGFGQILIMLGFILITNREKLRLLSLLAIPCISWWILFPNHAATFFYTPMHLFPFVGALFALTFGSCMELIQKKRWTIQLAALLFLVGLTIRPLHKTFQYLSRTPNPLDPSYNVTLGELQALKKEEIEENIQVSQSIRNVTLPGDIVLVPKPISGSEHFFEYYSQRRMDGYGDGSKEELIRKIDEIRTYKSEGAKKFKIFNPDLKLYALFNGSEKPAISNYVPSQYPNIINLNGSWVLFNLE